MGQERECLFVGQGTGERRIVDEAEPAQFGEDPGQGRRGTAALAQLARQFRLGMGPLVQQAQGAVQPGLGRQFNRIA